MRFHVGPITWDAELVSGPIEHNGHRCWGTCNCGEHKIVVWDQASPRMRLVTLIHEITHAWVYSVGPPGPGEEGLCNFIGTIMTQFFLDVYRQKMQLWRFLTRRAGCGSRRKGNSEQSERDRPTVLIASQIDWDTAVDQADDACGAVSHCGSAAR